MKELVVATKNKGKLREIKELLREFDLKITSLADYPNAPDIVEDGTTFRENALIKANIIAAYTNQLTMGEDSGLSVEALNNAPGIYSARYSGENATDEKNNQKLISELKGVPANKRSAKYHCCIALVDDEKIIDVVEGECSGFIATEPSGTNGFGYDPYFLIPKYNKTFGELDPSIKSQMSHRAMALQALKKTLKNYINR
ncbi:MAG: XTP/dITP diphosphatase [Candidatus Omnitrophica bacterium]|nr:XTP/dITP diphosphatase [Candidatus Omnitrophota bacterium]